MYIITDMRELHEWFHENKREFPWRKDPTPYKVWISEVMLQQTRASVVIPYFERWLILFPNVFALASAPMEQVIKAWEGLGYYSRARNLHKGARQIVEEFAGEIPSNQKDLESIHGIGPYTVGAILSFAFKMRAPAVDGNVLRVLSRYFAIQENVCKPKVRQAISNRAESILDQNEPWITSEALIELGATVCSPKPHCWACPLQNRCEGKEIAESLPIKNGEKETIHLKRAVLWIESQGRVLIHKGKAGKVMADLYEFPYIEMGNERWPEKKIVEWIEKNFRLSAELTSKLAEVSHTFTRYKAHLFPFQFQTDTLAEIDGYQWVLLDQLSQLPFSAGHRRILSR